VKRLLVALLACALLAAGLALHAAPAASAPTVINFDEHANFTTITNQYASRGVTFTGSGVWAVNNASMARSDPNHISPASPAGCEFCSSPITATFSPPQSRVRLWVGFAGGASSSHTTTLRAYDSSGALVGSAQRNYAASNFASPVSVALEVSTAASTIARIEVSDTYYSGNITADDLEFERPTPVLTLDPSCRGTTAQTLTVTAQNFTPNSYGYVTFDPNGPEQMTRFRIPINAAGTFSAQFSTNNSGRAVTIDVNDLDGVRAQTRWAPCPPPGVTTTTSTTTTVPDTVPDTTTLTTRPSGGGSTPTTVPSTTIPTIVEIPPATPGASLVVTPSLGPGGFVATAIGGGFPANQPVILGWSPGIGIFTAGVGPDGTFSTPVLVMNRDVLGPRTLVATSASVSATASFLVVPSTVQPSGKDVAQITRVRRFLQR